MFSDNCINIQSISLIYHIKLIDCITITTVDCHSHLEVERRASPTVDAGRWIAIAGLLLSYADATFYSSLCHWQRRNAFIRAIKVGNQQQLARQQTSQVMRCCPKPCSYTCTTQNNSVVIISMQLQHHHHHQHRHRHRHRHHHHCDGYAPVELFYHISYFGTFVTPCSAPRGFQSVWFSLTSLALHLVPHPIGNHTDAHRRTQTHTRTLATCYTWY